MESKKKVNTDTNINFIFVRHGYGCHNAIGNLINNGLLNIDMGRQLLKTELVDPELTSIGVDASINNGNIINKILKSLSKNLNNKNLKMDEINVIGCSPLIRSMETAYFMSKDWINPPKKIYVFPLLREIDESGIDKYSEKSFRAMETIPSYAMKSIIEQKQYLKSIGILELFDFSFVEKYPVLRKEPGDISKFINWFISNYISKIQHKSNLNVFIVTHAGVLKDYSKTGFVNNSGFVLNGKLKSNIFNFNKYISLSSLLPKQFFQYYNKSKWNNKSYYCPSNRCGNGNLCKKLN
jgi:hypothetical protein